MSKIAPQSWKMRRVGCEKVNSKENWGVSSMLSWFPSSWAVAPKSHCHVMSNKPHPVHCFEGSLLRCFKPCESTSPADIWRKYNWQTQIAQGFSTKGFTKYMSLNQAVAALKIENLTLKRKRGLVIFSHGRGQCKHQSASLKMFETGPSGHLLVLWRAECVDDVDWLRANRALQRLKNENTNETRGAAALQKVSLVHWTVQRIWKKLASLNAIRGSTPGRTAALKKYNLGLLSCCRLNDSCWTLCLDMTFDISCSQWHTGIQE